MARFIILTYPISGHMNPTIPIVKRLIEHNHEVVWIAGCMFKEVVESIGAKYLPLPKEVDLGDKDIYEFFPQAKELEGLSQLKWYIKHVFLDLAIPIIEVIDIALKDFPADVLIGDAVTPGVFFKSEISGIPSAMLSVTPLMMVSSSTPPPGIGMLPGKNMVTRARDRTLNFLVHGLLLKDVNNYANNLRRTLGLRLFRKPLYRSYYTEMSSLKLIMQFTTPAFEYPRKDLPRTCHFIGPVFPDVDNDYKLPSWWPDLKNSKPVVLVNQGTVAKDINDLIIPAIEGLKNHRMLIVSVPVNEGQLEEIPENVRTEPYIPFGKLLPNVDVMVTNGGYGATQMALSYGIPMVIAGATEDKMEVAARVEWAGCGINLRKKKPSPQDIQKAVLKVLQNKAYREKAYQLKENFAKYDAPTKAVELLEALASGNL